MILNDLLLSFNLLKNWISKSAEGINISEIYNETLISIYLDIKKQLRITTNLVSLSPGKFIFPFYFKIPKNVQPCFEYQTIVTKASIRYTINAQVISPYIQATSSKYIILKSRPIFEKKNLSFTNSFNVHKWGLFDGGSTILNLSILNGTDCFKNDENINVNIEIDNTKGKLIVQEFKFTLNANLNLKAKSGKLVKEETIDCLTKVVKTPTNIKEKKNFSDSISLKEFANNKFKYKEANLPYANISDISYFLPNVKSFITECNFTLKATLKFNKFVKHDERPRIIIPVFISHQSMEEYNNKINKFFETQSQNYKSKINNNQYNLNQINIINDKNQYNINQPQLNKSITLNNNNNIYEKPSLQNENIPKQVNDNSDLPSQEEIEKSDQYNEPTDLDASSYDAPAPAFQPNPK